MSAGNGNPGGQAGAPWKPAGEQRFHVQSASVEPLLQRLEAVQKSGEWAKKEMEADAPAARDAEGGGA